MNRVTKVPTTNRREVPFVCGGRREAAHFSSLVSSISPVCRATATNTYPVDVSC